MERLGLEEGEEILPGITIQTDGGQSGELPRALRRPARRGRGRVRGGGRARGLHPGGPGQRSARDLIDRTTRLGTATPARSAISPPAARSSDTRSRAAPPRAAPRPGSRPARRAPGGDVALHRTAERLVRRGQLPERIAGRDLAPSARATAHPSSIAPTSSARSSGVERISPSGCQRRLSCRPARSAARASTTSPAPRSRTTRAGMPASQSTSASSLHRRAHAWCARGHVDAQKLARVNDHARLRPVGLDADRARHDRLSPKRSRSTRQVVEAVEQRQYQRGLAATRSSASAQARRPWSPRSAHRRLVQLLGRRGCR